MQVDGGVGISELVGVLIGGVVGLEVFDLAEMRAADGEVARGETGDELLGVEWAGAHEDGASFAQVVVGGRDEFVGAVLVLHLNAVEVLCFNLREVFVARIAVLV